jgi:hypothetical protein
MSIAVEMGVGVFEQRVTFASSERRMFRHVNARVAQAAPKELGGRLRRRL